MPLFRRKKITCTVGPAPNGETMEFSFQGDHWSLLFPDVRSILQKGLTPCRLEGKSDGMLMYELGTDDLRHTLICEDGEVHIADNNYGLSVFIEKKQEHLVQRVAHVLRETGRFDLVCERKREE